MFAVNEKAMYVEFNEAGSVKRFVFPLEDSLIGKINGLSKIPSLSIEQTGTCTIQEIIPMQGVETVSGLDSILSRANGIYSVQLNGHPDVTHGTARFSQDLLDYLQTKEEEVGVLVEVETPPAEPIVEEKPSPVLSLVEQLKKQIGPTDAPPGQMTIEQVAPPLKSTPSKIPTLEEKLLEVKRQKGSGSLPTDKAPATSFILSEELAAMVIETNRVVKSIERSFNGEQKDVTGRELARWFHEYSYQHGADKAWDYIASKVHDW